MSSILKKSKLTLDTLRDRWCKKKKGCSGTVAVVDPGPKTYEATLEAVKFAIACNFNLKMMFLSPNMLHNYPRADTNNTSRC